MEATGRDYYQLLGVPRDADGGTIKRAYLRLIREHTPESAPDRFREISEAYRILSNPEKRSEYDSEERLPPAVQAELDSVFRLMESDPQEAKDVAEALRYRWADLRAVRFAFALTLLKCKEPADAVGELEELSELEPTNARYMKFLGDALLAAGQEQRGVRCLKQAITLDKDDRSAYIALSRHWMSKDSDDQALAVLDRGIHADGTTDVQDLPLFMEKLLILAKVRRWDAMKNVVQTLRAVVPADDADARSYAAWQLTQLAQIFNDCKVPHLTKFALDAAYALDPSRKEVRDGAESIAKAAALHLQVEQLMGDPEVRDWLKAYVYALWSDDVEQEKKDTVLQNVMLEIAGNRSAAVSHWWLAKRKYPDLASALDEPFQNMLQAAQSARAQRASASTSDGSGAAGCVWIIAIGVILALMKNC